MSAPPQHPPVRLEGAGNRFLLVDALAGPPPQDPAALARAACATDPFRPDGLLVLGRARSGELCMAIFNRDGSRPEACGNGLRCLAWYAVEAGHTPAGAFTVHTDAGARGVRVDAGAQGGGDGGEEVRVAMGRAILGPPLPVGQDVAGSGGGGGDHGVPVDVGNPHLVLWRGTLDEHEVEALGPRLEHHPHFPDGTNVEFAARRPDGSLAARVWERGVGQTAACGTGACAVAAVGAERQGLPWPVRVAMPGGLLTVDRDASGELWLAGPVELR